MAVALLVFWGLFSGYAASIIPVTTTLISEESTRIPGEDDQRLAQETDTTGYTTLSLPIVPTMDVVTKEQAPQFTFAVWDMSGKICILARFVTVSFSITYMSQSGLQPVTVMLPENPNVKGRCGTDTQPAMLELNWAPFRFIIHFSTRPAVGDTWEVASMELQYNTQIPLFEGAINPVIMTARSSENLKLMVTPLGKSFFCPSPDAISLYDKRKERVVMIRIKDIRIQSYDIEQGVFSPVYRCSQVRIGGMPEPFSQHENVTLAVGSILAVLSITVVLGYALYRSMTARRTDYDTME